MPWVIERVIGTGSAEISADRRRPDETRIMKEGRLRPAGPHDLPFLATMLGEAAVWRPDKATPTGEQVMADPRYAMYLEGWPRRGDFGLVAERDRPVGAAWYRRFSDALHGHGYVAAEIPELAIAVVASARQEGIGRHLLVELINASVVRGHGALSLSVSENNPARRLYESVGFGYVEKHGHTWTMVRHANDLARSAHQSQD